MSSYFWGEFSGVLGIALGIRGRNYGVFQNEADLFSRPRTRNLQKTPLRSRNSFFSRGFSKNTGGSAAKVGTPAA
ncbi:hypothetical protein [Leptospira tipperaryensis]|uniref:hypothetical protein n=1 Tax=Leptospira tipperaryensis TaxID=2564040 RepID=UPI0012EA50A6|nr:hypothetical protein [Leptospira tipperaryensis]